MRNLLKFLHLWIVVNLSPKNLIWRIKTTNYRRRLPALRDPFASSLLTGLKETGVVITHLDDLRANGIEVPDALIESALRLIEPLRQSDHLSPNLPYTLHGAQESLVTDFDMFTFALNPTLLSLVENYIGGNVHYRGCITRRDFADGREVETRLWHKDAADRRIIKVVIYCDDVTENDGPFSFIPRKKIAEHRISYTESRILDSCVNQLVDMENQIACTGRKGTIIFADTCGVFHRGAVPKKGGRDRKTLWYFYNSKKPPNPHFCEDFYEIDWIQPHLSKLSQRQRDALSY